MQPESNASGVSILFCFRLLLLQFHVDGGGSGQGGAGGHMNQGRVRRVPGLVLSFVFLVHARRGREQMAVEPPPHMFGLTCT